jgi:ParB-like nuclease domain.
MLKEIIKQERKMNTRPVYKTIDIDDIIANELNNKNRIRNIDYLKENIKCCGLLKPLEVYDNHDGTFTLIGGERRYTALRSLVDEDEYDPEIPCLVHGVKDKAEELIKLHMSNAQEEMSEEDKIIITKDLINVLKTKPELKPSGTDLRDWIATFLGCKGRTAQKYINLVKGVEPKKKEKDTTDYSYATTLLRDRLRTKVKINNGKVAIYFNNIDDLNNILNEMGMMEDV